MTTDLQEKAAPSGRPHRQDEPIVLIDAWDAAGLLEQLFHNPIQGRAS